MKALQIFEFYKNCGYKIIPLYHASKTPIFKNWNDDYDFEIIEIFLKSNKNPINFGILLGEIVDVEGDSEEANAFLDAVLKNIDHPVYQSSKSKHHLFKNHDSKLTRLTNNGVEFRASRHQSVIPPSTHNDGQKYKWITDIYRVTDIPLMPVELSQKLAEIKNKSIHCKSKKSIVKPGHIQVNCCMCENKCFLHKKRFYDELEIFKSTNEKWSCQKCRKIDLRILVRSIRKQERLTNRCKYSELA